MATPNAAGAAAMIREYLEEIALRDSPQGALVESATHFRRSRCWGKRHPKHG